MPAPPNARQRARRTRIDDITAEARRQLARDGAAALSLRSVARELGMVSSAVYRYVASRDELLTLLIMRAYDHLGAAIERALRGAGDDPRARWQAACGAVRSWARKHPQEYALIYGSPVPGYAAPPDTIGPATRVYAALADPVRHAAETSTLRQPRDASVPPGFEADGARAAEVLGVEVEPATMAALLAAWMQLFGMVSFELFGHTNNVITDDEAFFEHRVGALADALGL